jgi:hypothetical protein
VASLYWTKTHIYSKAENRATWSAKTGSTLYIVLLECNVVPLYSNSIVSSVERLFLSFLQIYLLVSIARVETNLENGKSAYHPTQA